jgi:hypothetical protein
MSWPLTTQAVIRPLSLKASSAAAAPIVVFHIDSVSCLSPSVHER